MRLPSDESCAFEREHHLVNRRWADAKIFLHVRFGGRPAVQACVQVDKRQILALRGRKGFCSATHCGHPIQLFLRASNEEEAQMNVRYRVELSQTERADLTALLSGGKRAARKLKRAQILLAADTGASDDDIATNVGVGGSTVYRTKQRFVLGNLEAALSEAPRPGASRKLSSKEEALLVATACSKPPQGRARWTLELLAGELVSLTEHASVSRETVRRRLAENHLKPWRKDMWCIPQVDGEYVARMEDVLDLYAEVPDPKCPVVCFDESPTQLIGEVASRSQPSRARSNAPTANINATERSTCSSSSTRIGPGVRLRSPNGEPQKTTPNVCASSSISIIQMPSTSGLCRITYRPIRPALCTRRSHPPKPGAFCDGWSSITPPSTQVGSTWLRSRSGCCAANASTDASTRRSRSNPKSLHGKVSAMPQALASNGCSQPTKLAPKWAAPTHSPLPSARPKPKSHNHCAVVLGLPEQLQQLGNPGSFGVGTHVVKRRTQRSHCFGGRSIGLPRPFEKSTGSTNNGRITADRWLCMSWRLHLVYCWLGSAVMT